MRRLCLCRALLSLFLVCSAVHRIRAQDRAVPELPRFEVATVKPVDPQAPHTVGIKVYPGGRVVALGLSLKDLIHAAFRVSYWQISGGDAWTQADMYDLEAKPSENSNIKDLRYTLFAIEDEHLREMSQALLIDRFQLKFHRETRTGDVYVLARSGKPVGLRPAEVSSPSEDTVPNPRSFGSIGYAGGRW